MMNFTYTPKYKKTPSDELFKQLYGFYPKKAGTSHELISTATYWHLIEKDNIADVILENKFVESKHDVRVKDVAEHQIDGIVELNNKKGKTISRIALEAKDHNQSNKGKNVPIDEVQKLDSTIRDIESFEEGVFFTSTDFTSESLNFIKGLSPRKHQKNIKLYTARPSKKEDERDRINGFIIKTTVKIQHRIIYPVLGINLVAFPALKCEYGEDLPIYDNNKNQISSISQAIVAQYGEKNIPLNGFVKIRGYFPHMGNLIPIIGFAYGTVEEILNFPDREVKPDGKPVLYVKSLIDGDVDVLITDTDLKTKINKLLKRKGIDVNKIKVEP